MIACIDDYSSKRRRVRLVDQNASIAKAVLRLGDHWYGIHVAHGGSVPNGYGYPAVTQVVGSVAMRHNGVDYVHSVKTEIPRIR